MPTSPRECDGPVTGSLVGAALCHCIGWALPGERQKEGLLVGSRNELTYDILEVFFFRGGGGTWVS